MMDKFTSLEEDEDDMILCKPVGTGSPPPPLCSGIIEGYNYFGGLPNPDPEDNSPRSHEGDFAALFSHNTRCSHGFSKQKKVNIFCAALGVNIDVLLGNSLLLPSLIFTGPSVRICGGKASGRWIALPSPSTTLPNLFTSALRSRVALALVSTPGSKC